MPSKNRVKQWAPQHIYHAYNRGNNKMRIFRDDEDYVVFLNLLKRSLQAEQLPDKFGRLHLNWYGDIELLAFCLMPNHFHLLLYQENNTSISKLMSSITTSYVAYFNKKYQRTGHLFQDAFKASMIDEDSYWQHISRYIHLNPKNWRDWEWSSLAYYLGSKQADWIRPERVLSTFGNDSYKAFVEDYEAVQAIEDELKYVRAN